MSEARLTLEMRIEVRLGMKYVGDQLVPVLVPACVRKEIKRDHMQVVLEGEIQACNPAGFHCFMVERKQCRHNEAQHIQRLSCKLSLLLH